MKAGDLKKQPTTAIRDAIAEAEAASATSGSMVLRDLAQDDGSVLTIASFQGGTAELYAAEEGIETDDDGVVLTPAAPADVQVPRLPESPAPSGAGTDDPEGTSA